ncbi:hypothetical protein [Nocardia sp. NPDC052566]|uniref:hypothetical protein n=1 Tax=Nocardia sp. NPDC052566 TaxID=3364330 RepID=UPI0037C81B7D
MAATDPLTPFQWLNAAESQADPLGEISSVGFFRNLEPSEVVRRCTPVPRAFALAAKVTGVSFTADMLDRPLLIGPIAYRWSPPDHTTA